MEIQGITVNGLTHVINFSIREITAEVGTAVLRAAIAEDLAGGHGEVGRKELRCMSEVRLSLVTYQQLYQLNPYSNSLGSIEEAPCLLSA